MTKNEKVENIVQLMCGVVNVKHLMLFFHELIKILSKLMFANPQEHFVHEKSC